MRRLYKQVYLAVVASLIMVVVFGGMLWQFAPQHRPSDEAFEMAGELVAAVGRPVPRPRGETGGWVFGKGGPAWAIRLPDDRWIVARLARRRGPPVLGILAFLGAVALAVG